MVLRFDICDYIVNSFLITNGHYQKRIEKAKKLVGFWEPHPDFLLIQAHPSVGIHDIRQIQKFLSRRPYQAEIKAVVLDKAELMTIPAQNAFLKTLEEPPANSLIILCSQNQDQLLPTITSRCQIIRLKLKTEIEVDVKTLNTKYSFLTTVLNSSSGKRLQLIEPYTRTREEAIKFCQGMIEVIRFQIRNKPAKDLSLITYHLSLFIKTLSLLQANVNVKLTLENLVINLPQNQ